MALAVGQKSSDPIPGGRAIVAAKSKVEQGDGPVQIRCRPLPLAQRPGRLPIGQSWHDPGDGGQRAEVGQAWCVKREE